MPWLKQLATVARRTGFPVVEVSGWQTRGHGEQPAVEGVVCHHTAGRNDRHVVVDGRPGLSGPLAQFWLARTGAIHVVAAGKCYHNNPSTSPHHDNSHAVGIEAENTGSEPWPAVQLQAYARLCAELCKEFGLPASRVVGHKEVQPGKPDPARIDMKDFRAEVARLMEGDDMTPDQVWHEAKIVMNKGQSDEHKTSPAAYLQHLETSQDAMQTQINRIEAKLDALLNGKQ